MNSLDTTGNPWYWDKTRHHSAGWSFDVWCIHLISDLLHTKSNRNKDCNKEINTEIIRIWTCLVVYMVISKTKHSVNCQSGFSKTVYTRPWLCSSSGDKQFSPRSGSHKTSPEGDLQSRQAFRSTDISPQPAVTILQPLHDKTSLWHKIGRASCRERV